MKRKILAVALILCMVLGTFGISFAAEEAWVREKSAPNAAINSAAVSVGSKIYVLGGTTPGDTLMIYDCVSKVWSKGAPMPHKRADFNAFEIEGKIYAVRGVWSNKAVMEVDIYDTVTGLWTSGMPFQYDDIANGPTFEMGKSIYFHVPTDEGFGGRRYVYDTQKDTWRSNWGHDFERKGIEVAVVGDTAYYIGGWGTNANDSKDIFGYRPDGGLIYMTSPIPTPRQSIALAVAGDKIYALGGSNPTAIGGGSQTEAEVFDTKTQKWEKIIKIPVMRNNAAAVVNNGRLYVIGHSSSANAQMMYSLKIAEPVPVPEPDVRNLAVPLEVGKDIQLYTTNDIDDNTAVVWTSSDQDVATVDSRGKVTAIGEGVCRINGKNLTIDFDETIVVRVLVSQGNVDIVTEKVNDDDSRIIYSGSWTPYSNDPTFYNNDEHFSKQVDSYAEFTFEGTGINWIGATSNNLGICDVYIDGELVQAGLDQYSSSLEAQKVLFSKTGLSNGQHTIKIVITGEKNSSAIDVYGTVDAFEVIRTE